MKKKILYPEVGITETAHHNLATAVIRKDHSYLSDCFHKIEQTAIRESVNWVVLSSEEFESARNLEALTGCFDVRSNVIITSFFRKPDSYLESEYNQHLKMYTVRFVGDIYKFYFTHNFHVRFNYNMLSNMWANRFGEKNFKPFIYDHIGQSETIYKLFLSLLEIELTDEFKLPEKTRMNTSLSNQATVYLSRLNSLELTRRQHQSALTYLEDRFGKDDSRLLPEAERKILIERFSGPNNRMAKRFLGIDGAFSYVADQTDARIVDYNKSFQIDEYNKLLAYSGCAKTGDG
ncbi:hypothetical protein L0152_19990 [bacterium]|nr:hypothetical protein [bacterium]